VSLSLISSCIIPQAVCGFSCKFSAATLKLATSFTSSIRLKKTMIRGMPLTIISQAFLLAQCFAVFLPLFLTIFDSFPL
jgi:hypothetical protein